MRLRAIARVRVDAKTVINKQSSRQGNYPLCFHIDSLFRVLWLLYSADEPEWYDCVLVATGNTIFIKCVPNESRYVVCVWVLLCYSISCVTKYSCVGANFLNCSAYIVKKVISPSCTHVALFYCGFMLIVGLLVHLCMFYTIRFLFFFCRTNMCVEGRGVAMSSFSVRHTITIIYFLFLHRRLITFLTFFENHKKSICKDNGKCTRHDTRLKLDIHKQSDIFGE